MECRYNTVNTCSKEIKFELNGDVVTNVEFLGGGCQGNLQALPKLVEGMKVEEINKKLKGILCDRRGTSCADQLANAVTEAYLNSNKKEE